MTFVRGWSLVVDVFFFFPFFFSFLFVSFLAHTTLTNMHSERGKKEGLYFDVSGMMHAMEYPRITNPCPPSSAITTTNRRNDPNQKANSNKKKGMVRHDNQNNNAHGENIAPTHPTSTKGAEGGERWHPKRGHTICCHTHAGIIWSQERRQKKQK